MTLPKTPKDRAEDLKACGAKVGKNPGYKRDQYRVECPHCGGVANINGVRAKFFIFAKDDEAALKKQRTFYDESVVLGDMQYGDGGVKHGDQTWLDLRAHLLGCHGMGRADDDRVSAVYSAHAARRTFEKGDNETRALLVAELAIALDSIGFTLKLKGDA